MEFEFIDEDEVQNTRSSTPKKTKSLYDSKIEDRTYWGNDPGTEIVMALVRMEIRKSIKDLKLIDIDNHEKACILLKEYRDDLRKYQAEMLRSLITTDVVKVVYNESNEWELVIVDYPY